MIHHIKSKIILKTFRYSFYEIWRRPGAPENATETKENSRSSDGIENRCSGNQDGGHNTCSPSSVSTPGAQPRFLLYTGYSKFKRTSERRAQRVNG